MRATLTVEFHVNTWDAGCKRSDLHEQVAREGEAKIRNKLGSDLRSIKLVKVHAVVLDTLANKIEV